MAHGLDHVERGENPPAPSNVEMQPHREFSCFLEMTLSWSHDEAEHPVLNVSVSLWASSDTAAREKVCLRSCQFPHVATSQLCTRSQKPALQMSMGTLAE